MPLNNRKNNHGTQSENCFMKTKHVHEHVVGNNGDLDLPLDKKVAEMSGGEMLKILSGFKAMYFEEFWYQRSKMFLGVKEDIKFNIEMLELDFYNRVSILLSMKQTMEKNGYKLESECHFDDDVIIKPIMTKFQSGNKEIEIISEGYQFWSSEECKVVINYDDEIVKFFSSEENKEKIIELVKKIKKVGENKSVLKNKVLKVDGTIIQMDKKYTWDDIILPDEIKEKVKDNVQDFFSQLSIYKKNNVACKRGIILHGNPGVGKSLIGKILASQMRTTFLWVTSQDMLKHDVRHIFNIARKLAPTIVFLEDMDFYAARRGENGASHILGELLAQLDGFENNHGVIVIGTTNDYKIIDSAISDRPNRFDIVLEVPKPNHHNRVAMLKNKFGKHNHEKLNFKDIADKTKDYSGSHIEELVTLSVIEAVKSKSLDDKMKVIIKKEHVDRCIESINPSQTSRMGIDMSEDEEDEECGIIL